MAGILENPTLTGLLGGGAVLAYQFMWNRVTGASDEKSLPVQLAEINSKLAGIELMLQLIKKDVDHGHSQFLELKKDFWDHIEKEHAGPRRFT